MNNGFAVPKAEATDEMIDAACAAVPDLYRVDAMRAIEAALNVASTQPASVSGAVDEPVDAYGRTPAQERQRQLDNKLLALIQQHFPSLPTGPGYTDWSKWLRFANAAIELSRAQAAQPDPEAAAWSALQEIIDSPDMDAGKLKLIAVRAFTDSKKKPAQQAPAVSDEDAEFEKWLSQGNACGCNHSMRKAWKARALLSQPAAAPAIECCGKMVEQSGNMVCCGEPIEAPAEAQVQWDEAQRICDLPAVDEAIRNLLADQTGDNATCMVRAILEAAAPVSEQTRFRTTCIHCGARYTIPAESLTTAELEKVALDWAPCNQDCKDFGVHITCVCEAARESIARQAAPSNQSQGGDKP
jgi:hypothetical protein